MHETEANEAGGLRIGWASADITPDQPVLMTGQLHARVSEGVLDAITATAMAIESGGSDGKPVRGILVSCDLIGISEDMREAVREEVGRALPELDPMHVVLNATHTHTAPKTTLETRDGGRVEPNMGIDLDAMPVADYIHFASRRIADAVVRAWRSRAPAGIGFGLGQATVGYNRLICDNAGRAQMYGGIDTPEFSHIEGGIDTSVNVLCVWNRQEKLIGVVVNLACPSQVSETLFQISADYWHQTRAALRERLGDDLFILPQVSAAGELAPAKSNRTVPDWKALERMWAYAGLTQRDAIARRITAAVTPIVEGIGCEIDWHPATAYQARTLNLPKRHITEQDVQEAKTNQEQAEQRYESLRRKLDADPKARQTPRWYMEITRAYRMLKWNWNVDERYQQQEQDATLSTEVHVLRLGDVAFATNQFELYLDFGRQIKGRSPSVQTFLVQLAGRGTYLPTQRAVDGQGFGSRPTTTAVGPHGGRELVERTVEALDNLWH